MSKTIWMYHPESESLVLGPDSMLEQVPDLVEISREEAYAIDSETAQLEENEWPSPKVNGEN